MQAKNKPSIIVNNNYRKIEIIHQFECKFLPSLAPKGKNTRRAASRKPQPYNSQLAYKIKQNPNIGEKMNPRKIFTGMSYFPTLREDNAVYIDKTAVIHRMVHNDKAFFLSRPRRFGKSLLVTTLEAYFQGRKELFNGLAMEKLEQDWTTHPVLLFDLSGIKFTSPDDLQRLLNTLLKEYELIYDIVPNESELPGIRLKELIRKAKTMTGQDVVILVDEYDAPLLDTIVDEENFAKMRNMLRSFYSPLKESGRHLRFVFLTGITKFSQLSIFSELNNLKIITMNDDYATICGITEAEIREYLHPEVEALAQKEGLNFEETMEKLKEKYDGYHFTENCPDIYNPYSLLNCLADKKLQNYWFSSATPTHLTQMLSNYRLRPEDLESFYTSVDRFDTPTESAESPIPILYQSGYLTIKSYEDGEYILGFPNQEVRQGFLKALMPYYSYLGSEENADFVQDLTRAMKQGDVELAMTTMRGFFSSIPYDISRRRDEDFYKTIFYVTFQLATAFNVRTEERTAAGRSDVVVETKDAVYVFEFKLQGTSEQALKQIEEKGYAIPYENGKKKLYKIGACFDEELRTLKDWIIVAA